MKDAQTMLNLMLEVVGERSKESWPLSRSAKCTCSLHRRVVRTHLVETTEAWWTSFKAHLGDEGFAEFVRILKRRKRAWWEDYNRRQGREADADEQATWDSIDGVCENLEYVWAALVEYFQS